MNLPARWMCLVPFLTVTACSALPPPMISRPAETLVSDTFSGKTVDTNRWAPLKGEWIIADGAIKGSELESDHHPAVLRTTVPFENAIIQFRFKLDGSDGISLSINQETGHHSRVMITPEGFALQKDRDKKDPESLSLPLGRCNTPFKPGVWYSMTVEYCGDNMLAWMDDRRFVLGMQEEIHTPKNSVGFTVRGSSAAFDDVTICSAVPSDDRAACIDKLRQQQDARADVSSDPRTAYLEAETILRDRLMKTDAEFSNLVKNRIELDAELHKRWPKAFRPGPAGAGERKKLLAENPEFKQINTSLAKARQAESSYLLKQDPALAALREAMLKAQKAN